VDDAARDGERLQKVLARAGLGSRRVCEEFIADGRVTVDGEVAQLGRRVDVERDAIALDGVTVVVRDDLVYYLLNKPAGYVSTASDPQARPTVVELVPAMPRVFPVGRLDVETEGLLLLTNDGDLTQLLTHPSFGVVKTYLAEVDGEPAPGAVRMLRQGVELDDGMTAPARVRIVQQHGATTAIEIGIHEGRNRQVRRMCDAVGHPVRRLVRTRIGPIQDRRLAPGSWRTLSAGEVRRLYEAATPRAGNPPGTENAPG
jgi:23S rRNA pseudouridine2605 synthase